MDKLDRYQEELEHRAAASTAEVCSASLADERKTDMPEELYPVTIIGCIRGVDGWHPAGYDSRTGMIRPLPEQAADGGSVR